MKKSDDCKKSIIAKDQYCKVVYCKTHQVAEIDIGSISIRLDNDYLFRLKDLLTDACIHLNYTQSAEIIQNTLISRIKANHKPH